MDNIKKLPPFKRFCMTIGELPSSYVESMSYAECIAWLCNYLKETIIPAINDNADAVNELINWFNNLDVQDEVDAKLDEMVEDGTLDEIINQEIFGQINSDISDLKEYTSLKDMPTLFIGDSYTNQVTSYAEYYKNSVGLDSSKFFKYARGGAGFHATGTGGETFIDLLNDAISDMSSSQKESIKQIIVGSCLNDANYNATASQVKDGISSFMTLVTANFPNAEVYIMPCGYRIGTTSSDISTRYNLDNVVMNVLLDSNTTYRQPIVIDNANLWLRNSDWFNEDNMHPNDTGQKIIANHLIRALNGNTEVKYHEFDLTITVKKDGSADENLTVKGNIIDNTLNLYLVSNVRLYNIPNLSMNTLQEIGTWSSKIIHTGTNSALDIPVVLRCVTDGPVDHYVNAMFRLGTDGKAYLYSYSTEAFTGITVFNVNRFTHTYNMVYK